VDPADRDLLQKSLLIAEDTNRTVHKLRRGMWWGRLTTVLFWLVITVGPVMAYYYYFPTYVKPYIEQIKQLTSQVQQGSQQAQNYQNQLSNFFGNLMPSTATTSAPQVPQVTQ
jgi:predicted PurR-regulated permease PerM